MTSATAILLAMGLWGLLHSLSASRAAKAWARAWLGVRTADGLYRLLYNALSVVTFLPVVGLVGLLPDAPLYTFPLWLSFITVPIQVIAALGALAVLWQVDLARFLGLRQLLRLASDQPSPREQPRLYTGGMYGWVRHPLYFFSLVFLWLTPVLTLNILAFNLGATLYFYIGSIFEERKLVADFGDVYREHQRRVPRLMPWPRHRP